jgi:dethiobiotin synthetase
VIKSFFITGTDTDVGKTAVAAAMLVALEALGKTTAAIKPVAAGAQQLPAGLRNEDGLILQRYQTAELPYEQVNPVLLQQPLSPHIAAARQQRRLTLSQLVGYCRGMMLQPADVLLIEGAGGWRVPINAVETLAGLPRELNIPVILVVGLRLGCLNHAVLTAEAIRHDGLQVVGWVANQVDPKMAEVEANIATLRQRLPGYFMGHVPWIQDPDPAVLASYVDVAPLLESTNAMTGQ